jgi:hypothetical protein
MATLGRSEVIADATVFNGDESSFFDVAKLDCVLGETAESTLAASLFARAVLTLRAPAFVRRDFLVCLSSPIVAMLRFCADLVGDMYELVFFRSDGPEDCSAEVAVLPLPGRICSFLWRLLSAEPV